VLIALAVRPIPHSARRYMSMMVEVLCILLLLPLFVPSLLITVMFLVRLRECRMVVRQLGVADECGMFGGSHRSVESASWRYSMFGSFDPAQRYL